MYPNSAVPIHEFAPVEPVDPVEMLVGRRSSPRLSVEHPARLQIGERAVDVLVSDISEWGARLEMDAPPPKGAEGVLMWEDVACACRVMWSGSDAFGVQFHSEA